MEEKMRNVEILIADRDEHLRSALKLLLLNDHHHISIKEAANADSFIHMINNGLFDLVIIDWYLDRKDVQRLISICRQHQSAVTIIALSTRLEDKTLAENAGTDAFVYKGDPPEQLQKTLLAYLETTAQDCGATGSSLPSRPRPVYCHYLI